MTENQSEYFPATRQAEERITEDDWSALIKRNTLQPQTGSFGSGRKGLTSIGSSESGGEDRGEGDRPTREMEFIGDVDAKRFSRLWTIDEANYRHNEISALNPIFADLNTSENRGKVLVGLIDKVHLTNVAKVFIQRVYFRAKDFRTSAGEIIPLTVFLLNLSRDEYGPFAKNPKLEQIDRRLVVKFQELIEFGEYKSRFPITNLGNERQNVLDWMNEISIKYSLKPLFWGS